MPDNVFEKDKSTGKYKYNIENLSYPIDLLGRDSENKSQYGSNYVIFYINVPEESKLITKNKAETINEDFSYRKNGTISAQKYSRFAATTTSVGVTGLATAVSSSAIGEVSSGLGGAVSGGGLITTLGAAVVGLENGSFSKAQKRLKAAIALHVPNQLSIRYSTNYSDEDTLVFQAAQKLGSDVLETALNAPELAKGVINDGVTESAKKVLKSFKGSTASSVLQAIGYNTAFGGDVLSAATQTVVNPKKEQIFRNVDFRSFFVDYQFFPRSEAEAKNILEIIKTFKYHMHPEYKDADEFLMLYPSEFDIVYYHDDKENKNIHKHTSCVLTEVTVNYTPNGSFTTFANGMPTQINMTMSFRELNILTKAEIEEGY